MHTLNQKLLRLVTEPSKIDAEGASNASMEDNGEEDLSTPNTPNEVPISIIVYAGKHQLKIFH